ncbi:MAG: heme exporter protein CcmB [Balneolaceae bacterium]
MNWLYTTLSVFKKDVRIEFRTRFAVNMVLAFVLASLLLILFTLRAQQLDPTPKSGLVWIVILFAALSALGRSFISETDKNTFDMLRVYAKGSTVYVGKLFYNAIFTLFINATTFLIYSFLMDLRIVAWEAFIVMLVFGTLGLSSVSTMTAAIVSQADRKGAVFSVLSIPLFVPLILLLTRVTKIAFIDGMNSGFGSDLAALVGFVGVTVTAGIILFDFIWED